MTQISPFDVFLKQTNPYANNTVKQYNTSKANKENIEKNNLKGVLLNTHIKDGCKKENLDNFDDISSRLLIPEDIKIKKEVYKNPDEMFDFKKALKPVIFASAITIASIGAISMAIRGYSKAMAKEVDLVRPGDLARNINILEEPHFAMYQVLRDPSKKKMLGFIGVSVMSAVTLCAKNLVDGVKEVWIKKQNCDIEHDLQENLINVETEVFSGKLNVVNTLLKDTTRYFKDTLSNSKLISTNFKSYLSFRGNERQEEENQNSKIKNIMLLFGGAIGISTILFGLYKNYQKTYSNFQEYMHKCSDKEIRAKILNAVSQEDKNKAIKNLSDVLKLINAKENTMRENLSKIKGITEEEINNTIKEIKSAQIFAQAPEALGGISEKIQYYCYINEERGHLYNWILNPENKFNKYLFLAFSAISATGYIAHACADAIKNVTVGKQNAKSELGLRKNLISTEINNFKSKKLSAINPLIDDFNSKLKKNKPKEELKELAENILTEIKNGPPYIYS